MNDKTGRATSFDLKNFRSVPMRTFWFSAIAFFLCFFSWFGIIPFMPEVKKELGLSPAQQWNAVILAVSGTVFARLLIGKLCDRYGPRLCYTWLLCLGAIPTILCGMVQTPFQFQICRLAMGFIGASFVITQVHTSLMFAPNIVGTANATSAGWGNLGGGANRLGMPLIAAALISFGIAENEVWRYAMVTAGLLCFLMGIIYFFFTQDTPRGNFSALKKSGTPPPVKKNKDGFWKAIKDYRVWILFIVYGVCFGIELTVYGTMDSYLQNTFNLERITAGNIVLSFALMNLFARTLGGYFGDRSGRRGGLRGRVFFLTMILIAEGIILMLFSSATSLYIGIFLLIAFSLAVQMAEGATFAVVPFINRKAIGSISGIVGAGGNVGAFLAALYLKIKSVAAEEAVLSRYEGRNSEVIEAARSSASSAAVSDAFLWIGFIILAAGLISLSIRFSREDEKIAALELHHQSA